MKGIAEKIINNEINAPALFCKFEMTSWGVMYYDEENPLCVGSNHAVITDENADALCAAAEIKGFYLSLGIRPAAEFPLCDGISEVMKEDIKKAGFCFEKQKELICMVKTSPAGALAEAPLVISEEREFDKNLCKTAVCGGYENFLPAVLSRLALSDFAELYVARLFGDGVSLCTVERGKKLSRLSNVLTGPGFRCAGFGSKTVAFAARKYEENYANPLYLLTENPLAARLYRVGGFEQIEFGKKLFRATLEEDQWQRFKSKNKPKNA